VRGLAVLRDSWSGSLVLNIMYLGNALHVLWNVVCSSPWMMSKYIDEYCTPGHLHAGMRLGLDSNGGGVVERIIT
jgi:hypothetical protein